MSEEIKIKVSQPMFEDGELERFDTYINEIANEFTKLHFEEKDKILTQRLVQKLEQENEKLNSIIKVKTDFIEELLKIIAVARDYELHDKCYTRAKLYEEKLQELKGDSSNE